MSDKLKISIRETPPIKFSLTAPGSGGGNVFSEEISIIKVLDREEYDALPTPRPVNTVYLIRG